MKELETIEEFKAFLESGTKWKNIAAQDLDLTPFSKQLLTNDFEGSIFLGCHLEDQVIRQIINTGGLFFPAIDGLPYKPFRSRLYTLDTLFDHFDPNNTDSYQNTTDWKIYQHYLKTGKNNPGTILESLARRLHDHAITDALMEFLERFGAKYRVVAVMGGHSLSRNSTDYKKVAHISRILARSGYLMITGGGPGAMEAAHLGVWFGGYEQDQLDKAIDILSEAPIYNDKYWLSRAFTVMEKFPIKKYKNKLLESIGIPTWNYGHEPPTPFASQIAKYFANSVREEGLLAIALGGVIFAPGSAGTIQEIFQDACQNHYQSFEIESPMIFLNEGYWKWKQPVYPLLSLLAAGKKYAALLSISDHVDSIVKMIKNFKPGS